jgi:hypothetical protein
MERETEITGQEAVEEAAAWSAVGVIAGSGSRQWQEIGTGTAVCWKKHKAHAFLTAAHVIRDTRPEDLRFMFRPKEIKRVERSELTRSSSVPTSTLEGIKELKIGTPILDTGLDLALIPVDGQIEDEYSVRFCSLAEGGVTPPQGTPLIAMGYPADTTKFTTKGEGVAFSSFEWTEVAANPDRDFDPARHFVAAYHMRDSEPEARPHGFSGAAFWQPKRIASGIWYPDLDIAGVIIEFLPARVLLKAVKREVVGEFLVKHLG